MLHVLLIDDDPDFSELLGLDLPRRWPQGALTLTPTPDIPTALAALGPGDRVVPIVVLSGFLDPARTTDALRHGVQDCVSKDAPRLMRPARPADTYPQTHHAHAPRPGRREGVM